MASSDEATTGLRNKTRKSIVAFFGVDQDPDAIRTVENRRIRLAARKFGRFKGLEAQNIEPSHDNPPAVKVLYHSLKQGIQRQTSKRCEHDGPCEPLEADYHQNGDNNDGATSQEQNSQEFETVSQPHEEEFGSCRQSRLTGEQDDAADSDSEDEVDCESSPQEAFSQSTAENQCPKDAAEEGHGYSPSSVSQFLQPDRASRQSPNRQNGENIPLQERSGERSHSEPSEQPHQEQATGEPQSRSQRWADRLRFIYSRLEWFARIIGLKNLTTDIQIRKMVEVNECRPYFTYWVTLVQILIFIVAVSGYGFAPIGFNVARKIQFEVLQPNQALEKVCWFEYENVWFGPRLADLIRLGAKYSPCMRYDENLQKSIIDPAIEEERNSACCIRNDNSGCYQTNKANCSISLSDWMKWPRNTDFHMKDGMKNRTSGSVCGQDPNFCSDPISTNEHPWPDDITKWPICLKKKSLSKSQKGFNRHMACEVTGRPCCVGIKGECIITSREHCDKMRGYYHQNDSLCSQAKCLSEICGMRTFVDKPNQYHRLFLSIFICPGFLYLIPSTIIHLKLMRDLEQIHGWVKISIIYILSGFTGNLLSAVFLPYHVQAGPSGSHFGLLALIFIERSIIRKPEGYGALQNSQIQLNFDIFSNTMSKYRTRVVVKYIAFIFFTLIIGWLPWFDNYAHIGGAISGLFLSYTLIPLPRGKISTGVMCLFKVGFAVLWIGVVVTLVVSFTVWPILKCSGCKYLNCVPFTEHFCHNMGIDVTERTICTT